MEARQHLHNQQRALQDLCGRNRVDVKEARCILAISLCGALATAVFGLQIRQESASEGDKLQKLFFPSLPRSAKYLLKRAACSGPSWSWQLPSRQLRAANLLLPPAALGAAARRPIPWKNRHLFSFPFTFMCLPTVLHQKSRALPACI